jgi:VWFA-related protein
MTPAKSLACAGLIAVGLVTALTRFVDPTLHAATHAASQAAAPAQTVPPLDADLTPLTTKNLVGHRLWIVVFDKSAMELADVGRAASDAVQWTKEMTPNVDLVAVAVISATGLQVLQDFTTNDAKVQRALAQFGAAPADVGATRYPAAAPSLDEFSNDVRLNGLKTICNALSPWKENKKMLYYTSGMTRTDMDNQVQYREALDLCNSAHVTIGAIDARGLLSGARGRGRGGAR